MPNIQNIKEKLQQLIKQYQQLQKENLQLKKQVEKQSISLKQHQQHIQELQHKKDLSSLQTYLLSKQEKAALEKRINKYLKEIDTCLTLLSKE